MSELSQNEVLHILRNPAGHSEDKRREVRLAAADLIEQLADETEAVKIDECHLHELLDRSWLLCEMFDTAITGHRAARLLAPEIDAVAGHLADLYQKIGRLRFEAFVGTWKPEPATDG